MRIFKNHYTLHHFIFIVIAIIIIIFFISANTEIAYCSGGETSTTVVENINADNKEWIVTRLSRYNWDGSLICHQFTFAIRHPGGHIEPCPDVITEYIDSHRVALRSMLLSRELPSMVAQAIGRR